MPEHSRLPTGNGMTDTRTNVWLRLQRSRAATSSAVFVIVFSMWAPIGHTDVSQSVKGVLSNQSKGMYADEQKLALNKCIEMVRTLTELQSVHTRQLASLQPSKPPIQPSTFKQPSSLQKCLAQVDAHKRLVAVYEAMIEQHKRTRFK
jgi:hypothetical protein